MLLTKIKDSQPETNVNLLCVVIQVESPITITTKRQETVEMAHLMVGDDTFRYFQVTLWGDKARDWGPRLGKGDVILLEHVRIELFRQTKRAQTRYQSALTVCYCRRSSQVKWPVEVDVELAQREERGIKHKRKQSHGTDVVRWTSDELSLILKRIHELVQWSRSPQGTTTLSQACVCIFS